MASTIGKETLNTFNGGMNTDLDVSILKQNQYRYAENARVSMNDSSTFGALSAIEMPSLVDSVNFAGYDIKGTATVRDIGVVFANGSNGGTIFRILFDSSGDMQKSVIFTSLYTFKDGISIVMLYEDSDNIKAYFADDGSPIRVINVSTDADSYNASVGDISKLGFNPPALLSKPTINSVASGNLLAGKYQYCYRLYSKYGTESSVSSLSNAVDIYASPVSGVSSTIQGSSQNESAGKSISIKIPYTSSFSHIKIISIYYASSIDKPVVNLILDTKFTDNDGYFYAMDAGNGAVDTILQDELNQIGIGSFIARHLESKDNILFAADVEVKEFVIDPTFDTRAFQFDSNGMAKLYSSDMMESSVLNLNKLDVSHWNVPKVHDCINKQTFTKERYSEITYKYDFSGNLGGEGVNVKYNFSNTYLIESHGDYMGKGNSATMTDKLIDDRIARIGDVFRQGLSLIKVRTSDGSLYTTNLSDLGVAIHDGHLNYANPLLSSALASYQRDEIYRFAAVFYDDLGRRSEAKWIADIRFPANYEKNSKWNASMFEMPSEVTDALYDNQLVPGEINLGDQELLVKPLGLSFTFKNIPAGVKRIEIVRAKRDLLNRTVVTQGVVQKTGTRFIENRDTDVEHIRGRINTLRPHPVLAMGYSYSSLGPYVGTLTSGTEYGIEPLGILGYDYIHSSYKYTEKPIVKDNYKRSSFRYNDHALSPYYSNRNHFMFISPEISYYKEEYVNTIKDAYPGARLVASDIIYPKATPALLYSGLIQSLARGTAYVGSSLLEKAQRSTSGLGSSVYMMPTAMYFSADLNESLIGSTNLITQGLLGANHANIYDPMTSPFANRQYHTGNISDVAKTMDIAPVSSPHLEPFEGTRAYISLGAGLTPAGSSANTVLPVNALGNTYPRMWEYAKSSNPIGVTFKYFCNFNKALAAGGIGGTGVTLIYQNSKNVMDRYQFDITNVGEITTFGMSGVSYAGEIDPSGLSGENGLLINSTAAKYVQAGDALFLNYHSGLTRGDSGSLVSSSDPNTPMFAASLMKTKVSGPHGDGIVFKVSDNKTLPSIVRMTSNRKKYSSNTAYDKYRRYEGYRELDQIGSSAMGTFVMNIKNMNVSIYGGPSYHNRRYSEYIPTGAVVSTTGSRSDVLVFGGDTYIGIFDYTIIRASDPMFGVGMDYQDEGNLTLSAAYSEAHRVGNVNALIPLETSINMRLSNSKSFVTSGRESFIHEKPGLYNATTTSNDPVAIALDFSQSFYNHKYNSAYSANKTGFIFVTDISDDETLRKDCRVIASDKKTIDEVFDSWATFRAANYIDVDTRYGAITRLKTLANRLFFLQEDAVGILSVNDRSLIKDNNVGELVLGSGGVLDRYDYVSTNNGLDSKAINSLSSSPYAMYWYDHRRSELCMVDESVSSLSKVAGIQKILNKNGKHVAMNVPIAYDRKYNEVLFTMTGMPSIKDQVK